MSNRDLAALLHACVQDAEQNAPATDPLSALAARRERRTAQRGHIAVLAFVFFVLGLQLLPSEAFGEQGRSPSVLALSCADNLDEQGVAGAELCR